MAAVQLSVLQIPVKPAHKEYISMCGYLFQPGWWYRDPAFLRKVMGDHLPCPDVMVILPGRELGDPHGPIRIYYICLWPCAAKG